MHSQKIFPVCLSLAHQKFTTDTPTGKPMGVVSSYSKLTGIMLFSASIDYSGAAKPPVR